MFAQQTRTARSGERCGVGVTVVKAKTLLFLRMFLHLQIKANKFQFHVQTFSTLYLKTFLGVYVHQ